MGISTVTVAILRNDGVYIAGIKNNTRTTYELKTEKSKVKTEFLILEEQICSIV